MKQILQMKHNMFFKNPNWREANQLAVYKRSRRIYNPGLPLNKSMMCSEWDSNPGPTDSKYLSGNSICSFPALWSLCEFRASQKKPLVIILRFAYNSGMVKIHTVPKLICVLCNFRVAACRKHGLLFCVL